MTDEILPSIERLRPAVRCNPDCIPAELKEWPQFVLWKLEPNPKGGKPRKILISPRGLVNARTHDEPGTEYDRPASSTWSDFETARDALTRNPHYAGLGFVFTSEDPFIGGDIDGCRDPETGELTEQARAFVTMVDTYTEVSQSGTGIHFIGRGKKIGSRCKDAAKGFELYDTARYFVLTGHRLDGTPPTINDRAEQFVGLEKTWFPDRKTTAARPQRPAAEPTSGALSDTDLLAIAFRASNGDKVRTLYGGDLCGYGSESEARFALLAFLAFYTQGEGGGGTPQLERLVRASGRDPEKFDRLLPEECRKIAEEQTTTYQPQRVIIPRGLASLRSTSLSATRGPETPLSSEEQQEDPQTEYLRQRLLDKELCEFPQNDVGNAQRLVARHGEDIRYDFDGAEWLIWDGKRFRPDKTGEITRRAMDTAAAIYHEAGEVKGGPPGQETQGQKILGAFARKTQSERGLANMEKLARVLPGIAVCSEQMDADPMTLPVANGLLDLRTGTLRPHERQALNTKLVDIVYDQNALCPTWEWFLDWAMFGDQSMISFLQQAVGYSLTGDVREQCLFFLYGIGRNGKTTFVEVVESLLGEYGDNVKAEAFLKDMNTGERASPSIAKLKGRRVVTVSEMEDNRRLDEALIKGLTGGDTITARFLHKNEISFKPTFKIFWFGNHLPNIRGIDDGIWRRQRLIPFLNQIPEDEKDPTLKGRLAAELPGILAWAVRGCLEWLAAGKLATPSQVKEATDNLRTMSDPVGMFISDLCDVSPDLEDTMANLHGAYMAWYQSASQPELKVTMFAKILESKGFTLHKTRNARMRKGLRLRADDNSVTRFESVTGCDAQTGYFDSEIPHVNQIAGKRVTTRHGGINPSQMPSKGEYTQTEDTCSEGNVQKRSSNGPQILSILDALEPFGQMIADAEQNAIPPQRVKLADGCDVQNLNAWVKKQARAFRVAMENEDEEAQQDALSELQNCFPAWRAIQ